MPLTANKLLKLQVSDDKLAATVMLNNNVAPEPMQPEQIASEISATGILLNDQGLKAIAHFAKELENNEHPEPVIIASGTPPAHEKNGVAEKLYQSDNQQDQHAKKNTKQADDEQSAGQSHYDRTDIISVACDMPIMKLHPPTPGKDGTNVYGETIPRKLGIEAKVKLGPNVRQQADVIYAECDGCVNFKNNRIWVDTILDIPGNVDFSSGNIHFCGDVNVAKNVIDLFKVHSDANIYVQGLIEAAEVAAKKDLHCVGGMAGKEKGVFSAGNDIIAKYITNAAVRAGNNVKAYTEIVNCRVVCGGKVIVENGPLVGGHIIATRGIQVKQLGSEAGVQMLIEVGVDQVFREKCLKFAPLIDQKRAKAQKVRQVVEPLLANQKHLNEEQKEKATELLYQSYELEDEVNKMISELRHDIEKYDQNQQIEVEVLAVAFAGPTIRFPQVEAKITEPLQGPVKFMPRKEKGIIQVVAVDAKTKTTYPLKSGGNRDNLWEILDRLLNPEQGQ